MTLKYPYIITFLGDLLKIHAINRLRGEVYKWDSAKSHFNNVFLEEIQLSDEVIQDLTDISFGGGEPNEETDIFLKELANAAGIGYNATKRIMIAFAFSRIGELVTEIHNTLDKPGRERLQIYLSLP